MSAATDVATGVFVPTNARTGKPCKLAMQELRLSGRVMPVGARLTVRHVFRSGEKEPIEVIYAFGLPRDAALRRFKVQGEGFSVHSDLKPFEDAQKTYEQAIEAGHLAALTQAYRDGVANLSLGNVRPGETVVVLLEIVAGVEPHDDGFRFRFPFTLAPTYHAKARPVEVAEGEGEMELPDDDFGDVVFPRWAKDATALHRVGFHLSVAAPDGVTEIASPSHPLRVVNRAGTDVEVFLGTEADVPDRDLVLDVRYAETSSRTFAGTDTDGKGRFAAVIPSRTFGKATEEPRRVVFVLDRSGSMDGPPMEQALRATRACLGALSPGDCFAIVAFDTEVCTSGKRLLAGDSEGRARAERFLGTIHARGGTELALGLAEAARLLGEGGGDVLLLTDGQVGGTEPIIGQARKTGVRIHCLGIGSASQDRFLALLAQETGGTSRMLTPRERVDTAAVELFAAVGRPIASAVQGEVDGLVGANLAPAPSDCVFAGNPIVIFGSTSGPGTGRLRISWKTGRESKKLTLPFEVGQEARGDVLRLLQGAKLIAAAETEYGGIEPGRAAEKRRQSRIGQRLESLSREYGLASRSMALVAVVERPGDMPGEVPKTTVVPVGMPQDVRFDRYFGATMAHPPMMGAMVRARSALEPMMAFRAQLPQARTLPSRDTEREGGVTDADVVLLDLASRIEPDGGLPGKTQEERVLASLLALLTFAAEGHTIRGGLFAAHAKRLHAYLASADLSVLGETLREASAQIRRGLEAVLRCVEDLWAEGDALGESVVRIRGSLETVLGHVQDLSRKADVLREAAMRIRDRLCAGEAVEGDWLELARLYLDERAVPAARFWRAVATAQAG